MNEVDHLIVGCGSVGLRVLSELAVQTEKKIVALEASNRVGGAAFFVSRLYPVGLIPTNLFTPVRTLPPIEIWWDRTWVNTSSVDWSHKDWAFALPQWQIYFGSLVEGTLNPETAGSLKSLVQFEKPVSHVRPAGGRWIVESGETTFSTQTLHWTLGLKAFRTCLGKKEAEDFTVKNTEFNEDAREAEGVFVAEYAGSSATTPDAPSRFLGIPVRHEGQLFLSFVSVNGSKVETFTFLPAELLTYPKLLSSFEKSLKRSIKHVVGEQLGELATPNIGTLEEARGFEQASAWSLKSSSDQQVIFYRHESSASSEDSSAARSKASEVTL